MYPLFHAILIEPDADCAQMLTSLLTSLGAVVTHAADPARGTRLMSHLLPDLLVVGVHLATAHTLHPWLPAFLTDTPLQTLLYTDHPGLLDVTALTLPLPATIMRWPCSQSELALLLAPLVGDAERGAAPAPAASPCPSAPHPTYRMPTAAVAQARLARP